MRKSRAENGEQHHTVSRRRFVGEVAVGAAGAAVMTTHSGCSSAASSQPVGSREFLRPNRFEWKRREVHPRADRGWSDTNFPPSDSGVPESLSIFGETIESGTFASALADTALEMELVYAFWDGTFARTLETVAPLSALVDRLGLDPPTGDRAFVVASSPSRERIFEASPERAIAQLTEVDYRYRLTFPRDAALDSGVVVFQLDTDLQYYAFAVEGYGARAFVKYFERIEAVDTYQGPADTALDDYVVANIPADDFLDLDSDERVAELPDWA